MPRVSRRTQAGAVGQASLSWCGYPYARGRRAGRSGTETSARSPWIATSTNAAASVESASDGTAFSVKCGARTASLSTTRTTTWPGHASFRLESPGGKRIYVDPWLGGPTVPDSEKEPERIDVIAVTHGHGDHVGDTVALHKRFGCPVLGMVELVGWLTSQGVAD